LLRHSPLAAAVAVAVFHVAIRAQDPSGPGARERQPAASLDPAAVRVEAIVTDKQGKPILNLRSSDFVVRENGIPQKLDNAVLMSKSASQSSPSPIDSNADLEQAAREPGTRIIALYLDEFHVNPGVSTERVRQALMRFVNEQLRPADLVVVMKPLDSVTDIMFTRDRDTARKAVAAFDGRKGDYTARTAFEQQYLGRSPEAVRSARAQIVMSGLRALTMRMGELDGDLGAIVLVSEGFNADVPRSRERRLPDLQGLVRAASRARLLLYAFDPAAAAVPVADSEADDGKTIQAVAKQTGGQAVAAGDDLESGFQRVSRDLDSYYVLTYHSTQSSDGRFHPLEVTSTRRDVLVRTRSGYWAPLPFELRTGLRPASPPTLPMRAVRRSPLIDAWFGSTVEPDGRRRAIFTWSPAPASPLVKKVVRPEILTLKVSAASGRVLFEGELSPVGSGSIATPHAVSAVFDAPIGRLQFDFTVLAADGSKLDTGAQDFDVPEIRSGPPVILAPQLFRAASAREFREIRSDANAAPLPGREFRRTDRLLMRVPTFDPAGKQVQVSAKLINRVGATVIELIPTPEGPNHLSQFDLPLARFAPGEYSLEVAAQSDSGTARQLVRFRITG
jgi:VWFA-related protein